MQPGTAKNKRHALTIFLFLLPSALLAQANFNLKGCLTYGLKNHPSIRISGNNILNAKAQQKEAVAAYLPSINFTGSLTDNIKAPVSIIPAGTIGPKEVKVAFTTQYASTGTAELDQAIYDQSALTGLNAGKYNMEQAKLNQRQNEETLIYNISTDYYQVFIYQVQLHLLQGDAATYSGQLEISNRGVRNGTTEESDRDKILVNYNNTVSNILVARSNLSLSIVQLKNAMGFPLDKDLPLDSLPSLPGGESAGQSLQLPGDSLFIIANRTEYLLDKTNVSLQEINAKQVRAGALPTLSFFAKYGGNGYGDQLGQSLSSIYDFSAIGINLKVPLFDGFKRNAQYHEAKYKQANAEETMKIDAANYRTDFETAKTKLLTALINVTNNKNNIALAESVFKSTDLKYRKGVTDLTDWLNAQNSLNEAQNNYLNTLYSFYGARLDFEKARGGLKSYYSSL